MIWESSDYTHEGSPITIVTGKRAARSFSARGLGLADGTYVPDSATVGWRAHCSCGWESSELVERVSDPRCPRRLNQILDQFGGPALPETRSGATGNRGLVPRTVARPSARGLHENLRRHVSLNGESGRMSENPYSVTHAEVSEG